MTGLVVSPNYEQDGLLFGATLEDGVLRSPDRGRRWHAWNFGLLDMHVLALAISPAFAADETLFAATETGVYRSTNGGRAWRETGFPSAAAPVVSLALSPAYQQDGTLFAGTDAAGLYRSADRGRTWRRVGEAALAGPVNALLWDCNPPDCAHLLALEEDRLLASPDAGATWAPWPGTAAWAASVTAVAAPYGLAPGAALLVGLLDGRVLRVCAGQLEAVGAHVC